MNVTLKCLLLNHLCARPHMQVQDIYKLIYQSSMGLGHLLTDSNSVLDRLKSEMEQDWPSAAAEPLTEDITLRHPMVRVNLRSFVLAKLPPEMLYTAMLETQKRMVPNPMLLKMIWGEYLFLEVHQSLPGHRPGLCAYAQCIQNADFPVQHHSPVYREKYSPSYRIVDGNIFCEMLNAI